MEWDGAEGTLELTEEDGSEDSEEKEEEDWDW
jgi:hypothetical protein